jgi:hypothetical protein
MSTGTLARLAVALPIVLAVASGGCGGEEIAPQPAHPDPTAATPASASAPASAIADATPAVKVAPAAEPPACPALDVTVPGLAVTSRHDAALQDIVDFGSGMDPFFAKLARLARGEPGVTVRIGVYGDSNLANDRTLGYLRRLLQPMWGDGGHGWVAFGLPWVWYKHMDVRHGTTGNWASYNLSSSHAPDYFYGFGGTAAESSEPGATAWVATAKTGATVGTAVSAFILYYMARPKGGTFEVGIDGVAKETIDTTADEPTLVSKRFDVDDGPHKLTVTVKKGRVRVFGAVLERGAGLVVDSLGIASLNPWLLGTMDKNMAGAGLADRNYDLLLETSGSNMCASKYLPGLLDIWHAALPHSGILLWSPPDAAMPPDWHSEPLMKRCQAEKQGVAKAGSIAFWDLYAALGGAGSMPRWLGESRTASWCEPDGLHLGPMLNKYIAERFAHAIIAELDRRAHADARLGCPAR